MNTSAKGRRAEHRARKQLEDMGYVVMRAAASKGLADLAGWNVNGMVLVQVKSGRGRVSPAERAAFKALPVPTNCRKEIWCFPDRQPVEVEVLA